VIVFFEEIGAGEANRTPDPNLGKVFDLPLAGGIPPYFFLLLPPCFPGRIWVRAKEVGIFEVFDFFMENWCRLGDSNT
jgi:hypothetical protein